MRRFAPLSGIVFVVLTVVAFGPLGGNTPGVKKSAADIASFYGKHHSREANAAFVLALATFFLALFVASGWALLRDEGRLWPALFFGGGIVTVGIFLIAAGVHLALADAAHHGVDPSALQAINAIDADNYVGFGSSVGIMLLGGAGAMIPRSGALKWLGWLALVLGISTFTPAGFVGFAGGGIWIIAVSIVLFMQAGRAGSDGATA
jgi:hypothetical protein